MKGKLQFPVSLCWFLPVLVFMLVSCGDDDDYHYPSVKLDFLTAQAGADGSLQSVLTDEGETLAIVEDASKTRIDANASARIVSNYGKAEAADGTSGVKLYAVLSAISPVPQSADKFKDGIKRDPADILSIWMGIDYLNIMLEIKSQNGKHSLRTKSPRIKKQEPGRYVCLSIMMMAEMCRHTRNVHISPSPYDNMQKKA